MLLIALELYNKLLNSKNDYYKPLKGKKTGIKVKNLLKELSIDVYLADYKDEDKDDLLPMPPIEGGEEVKLEPEETIAERVKLNPKKRKNEGTRLKILTPNKLLTRFPILLAHIKAGNNSCKLKNEMKDKYYIISFVSA